MNRQAKFRAMTLNYDPMTMPLWAEGFYYQELDGNGDVRHFITDGAHTFYVNGKTVGEFTCYKDNNCNDIFENDIVKNKLGEVGVIVMYHGEWRIKWGVCERHGLYDELDDEIEVIGNIYENKELFNKEDKEQCMTLEKLWLNIKSRIVNFNGLKMRNTILFKNHKKTVIEGWVLRDDNNKIGIYRDKPTCDEDGYWDLTGERYDPFPDITPETEPKRYKITITPIDL